MQVHKRIFLILPVIVCLISGAFFSCEEEKFMESPGAQLNFSTDTVMFDTIFTTIGSTPKRFTVNNPYDKSLRINSIRLAGGKDSDYRLNINGTPTNSMTDIKLDGNDSLYIFVEVTVDPNNHHSPMVVKDSVIFNINDNLQDIKLVAWGQDVHLINGRLLNTQTWKADKPYLIYNSAMVDTQQTLTIEPGVKVHFHRNSRFFVAGTLISQGTKDDPVVFTSDRLEEDYSDVPGQWDGIWLMPGSKNNHLHFTHIKNAIIGLQVDTLGNPSVPTLTLSNSKIEHMTYAGIYARGTTIKAYNNVISDCGEFAVALTLGGSYEFYHTTIANYWASSTRNTPSLFLNNHYIDTSDRLQIRELEKALFSNCIIYGNQTNEFDYNFETRKGEQSYNYTFDHCLIKMNRENQGHPDNYRKVMLNKDPLFVSVNKDNFRLDTLSPAIDKGDIKTGERFPLDILNNSRASDEAPDLGAYEYIPGSGQEENE